MAKLEDVVRVVVDEFMKNEVLFTALDVSNKVKETMPFARHREVRDLVRDLFATDISPANWARTPVTVILTDGSNAEALLYHPLSDSWNLDAKYDAQKRAQMGTRPNINAVSAPVPATVASDGTVTVVVPVSTPSVPTYARTLWDNMFSAQPSLFPRK